MKITKNQVCYSFHLLFTAFVIATISTSCDPTGSSGSGGGNNSGDCATKAQKIQLGMTSAQVIKIMGNPDVNNHSYDGSETFMEWICGTHGVAVDFQPGDSVYIVEIDGSAVKVGPAP